MTTTTDNLDLARRVEQLERGTPPGFCPLPPLPISPSNEEKFTRDERARRERVLKAQRQEELAAAERERRAEEARRRREKNAPRVAKLKARIAEVDARREPLLRQLEPLDTALVRLRAEIEELTR